MGSVTRSTTSAVLTDSITGHDVPGGASSTSVQSLGAASSTARITGGAMASPMFSFPCRKVTWPEMPSSTTPVTLGTSRIAPSGQASEHPPQPWQSLGKVRTFFGSTRMAE